MSITDADRTATFEEVVDRFAAGWRCPHPHAWDDLLALDVTLEQPLMPHGVGREHWQREFARLQAFLPDLRGEILGWSGRGDTVHVEVRCRATVGGRELSFTALDQLTVCSEGLVVARRSYLDPFPLIAALLARPRSWSRWWRSGVAPLTVRRAVTGPPSSARGPGSGAPRATPPMAVLERAQLRTARTLGVIRAGVGVTALASPRTAHRALRPDADTTPIGGFLARGFGIRELVIAALTLSANPATVRLGLRLGVVVDTVDTATVVAGRREIASRGHWVIGLPAAVFAAPGAIALKR